MNSYSAAGTGFLPAERKLVLTLSGLMGLRMLGLFMVLPVLALYADRLPGATPSLVGWAVGIYGLTQALLQIPAGGLSDRIGRRPVIIGGLLLFGIGSVVAALAESTTGLLIGRALQGAGAIAAAVTALVADSTRESQRTKAMAILGMSIGAAFMLSLIVGPMLAGWVGVPGLFWLTALLAGLAIAMVWIAMPTADHNQTNQAGIDRVRWSVIIRDPALLRLDIGIFILHAVLTALFVALPFVLRDRLDWPSSDHWTLYLTVMLASLVLLVPALKVARRQGWQGRIFQLAILLVALAMMGLALLPVTVISVAILLWLFFGAFNFLEASLPSLISSQVNPSRKGAALGVYSTSQFAGAFVGAVLAGWILDGFGAETVFAGSAVLAALWLLIAAGQRFPAVSVDPGAEEAVS